MVTDDQIFGCFGFALQGFIWVIMHTPPREKVNIFLSSLKGTGAMEYVSKEIWW